MKKREYIRITYKTINGRINTIEKEYRPWYTEQKYLESLRLVQYSFKDYPMSIIHTEIFLKELEEFKWFFAC